MKNKFLFSVVLLSSLFLADTVLPARQRSKRNPKPVEQNVQVSNNGTVSEEDENGSLDIATLQEETTPPEQMVTRGAAPETEEKKTEDFFDFEAKRKDVVQLVERGVEFLKKNPTAQAFKAFSHTSDFTKGELYLFVFDDKGYCLADGSESSFIWKNLYDLRDTYGTPIVQSLINKAKQGGGWTTYSWRNSTKTSYVQELKKDGKTYIIGCGYYPHSKEFAVVNLVKGAVALFNDLKKAGRPKEEAFSTYNYPTGKFVYGDLYLYALDFNGTIMAQADRPGLVGSNRIDYQDANGKFSNQEIINKLKESPDEGIWTTYVSKRASKRTYAERVVDSKGVNYFIACGYYPDANRDAAVDLVKKGFTYMKAHGKGIAAQDFTSKSNEEFRYGDLYLIVYDMKGNVIAHGDNSELIGQNLWNSKDEDGRLYVQELIQKAKDGGGWVDFKTKNSLESMYVEEIDLGLPENRYVIACGTFPVSKAETVNLLVKSAVGYLRIHSEEDTFGEFSKTDGRFIRGDLDIFVVDTAGLCYVFGDNHDMIWQNLMNAKDEDGKHYIKLFINTVKQGAGSITFKINGSFKAAYVDLVEKDGKNFIVGSSYFK